MIIREMQINDLNHVLEIEKYSYKSPWSKENFEYEIVKNEFSYAFVVEEANKLIGYYIFWHLFDEANITKITVDKNYRDKGIGSVMLQDCLKRINILNCKKVYLEVREGNNNAIKLYKKHKFEEKYLRKKYYDDGENALIFEKEMGDNNG